MRKTLLLALCIMPSWACAADEVRSEVLRRCPGVAAWEAANQQKADGKPSRVAPEDFEMHALLVRLEARDQEVRAALADAQADQEEVVRRMMQIDADNLAELKQLVADKGFPDRRRAGDEGMRAFWLLVQHAASDPGFQERALEFLENNDNRIEKAQLAMLIDRLRVARGQPQIYGTQFQRQGDSFVAYAMEQPEAVDIRRAERGLMPLADYKCLLDASYDKK